MLRWREAYFEIAENKKSPSVLAENVKIQVTGTCFNVKAYASDKVIKTTLDEGSINIGHVQSRDTYAANASRTNCSL